MEVAMRGRIVLVADLDEHWAGLVRALEREDLEIDVLPPRTSATDVVACAARARAVVIVDLSPDPSVGLTIAAACRAAGVGPVVAVADSPSADLARRVRLAGAFYLALRPVDPDEMRTILQSAFQSIDRQRTGASSCRDTRRILIVDDDPDFVASTTACSRPVGTRSRARQTGGTGLRKPAPITPTSSCSTS
jgi:DNA-binding NtrC family response regulator